MNTPVYTAENFRLSPSSDNLMRVNLKQEENDAISYQEQSPPVYNTVNINERLLSGAGLSTSPLPADHTH